VITITLVAHWLYLKEAAMGDKIHFIAISQMPENNITDK
jgi:hypothetical protein